MKHVRDVLNEFKWRNGFELDELELFYRDHARPQLMVLEGAKINSWDKSFIYTDKNTAIPYHRVERIEHKGEVIYYRKGK
jgi:uncharacterized protein (UPF0248 family)